MRNIYSIFLVLSFLGFQNIHSHDKWIVVTTINKPNEVIRKLAHLPDWKLVVVGDLKTSSDWNMDNCTFLSVDGQKKLNFKIAKLLPENHYARKNIGYLYAIQHGAKIIYETDDDNFILGDTIQYLPEYTPGVIFQSSSGFINPYEYFGQKSVWPRGYPLESITQKSKITTVQSDTICTPIQQGLVNIDPDVDAIFRLTQNKEIKFLDYLPPLILQHGTVAPFNSQNTIFYHKAFWGLFLPTSVSSRVSDIWRGYITQFLLSNIDAHVSFIAPTAEQFRNEHILIKDFEEEYALYTQTTKLIDCLRSCFPTQHTSFKEFILEVIHSLVNEKMLQERDYLFAQAWLEDLENCGYEFPEIQLKSLNNIVS